MIRLKEIQRKPKDSILKKIETIEALNDLYFSLKPKIISRLNDFRILWEKGSDEDIFYELIFCLLTPQSKAKLCWRAVEEIRSKQLINKTLEELTEALNKVRFKNNKAKYIFEAKNKFFKDGKFIIKSFLKQFNDSKELRKWLVKNIKGMGYKEASHFLRNIHIGLDLAILDRHILRNLELFQVIPSIPKTLTPKLYEDIENKMKFFSSQINIPLSHLDFVFWYIGSKDIFK